MSLNDLIEHENKLITKMGASFGGERVVFRGKDLHHDLKDLSWFELFLYNITGRFFKKNELNLLNFMWVSTSYPDPRIWNNRVVALGGSYRSTNALYTSAGIAMAEANLYGIKSAVNAFTFLERTIEKKREKLIPDILNEAISKKTIIYGYGRPISPYDERIFHLFQCIERNRIPKGEFIVTALEIEKYLYEKKRIRMNAAGLYGAIAGNLGFSKSEFHAFCYLCFLAAMPALAIEALEKPEGCFFPIRCNNLYHQGETKRQWTF